MAARKQLAVQIFNSSNILSLIVIVLWATVAAAVPQSVLLQNTELTANAAAKNINGNSNNNNNDNNVHNKSYLLSNVIPSAVNDVTNNNNKDNHISSNNNNFNAKVKRSSVNGQQQSASAAGLEKKSSLEIVPASFNSPSSQKQQASADGIPSSSSNSGMAPFPSNDELFNTAIAAGLTAAAVEAAAAASQREYEQQQQQQQQAQLYGDDSDTPSLLYKRGITPQQYLYGAGVAADAGGYGNADYYNINPYYNSPAMNAQLSSASLPNVPNGVWGDELDPGYVYSDLQELDDYASAPRAPSYRSKAYDNLQNILNSETYMEPVPLPLQYAGRYYGAADADRNKRGSNSLYKYNKLTEMRPKRDSKLTPADMLALVALVEAGERARKDNDADVGGYPMYPASNAGLGVEERYSPKSYYANSAAAAGAYDYPATMDDMDEYNNGAGVGVGAGAGAGAWLDPAMVDYYGMPVNVETMPKYELAREHKYGGNRLSAKRFMVSKKKKRSVVKQNVPYNGDKYF